MGSKTLLVRGNLATLVGPDWGAVEGGALVAEGGVVAWLGPEAELPERWRGERVPRLDAGEGWVTPGLVDCHTHLVFGGTRVEEFEARLQGATYEELARAGGGILSTVRATRAASEEALLTSALGLARGLMARGVTTLEVKSGYGLDRETELRMLRVARRLDEALPLTVHSTFLGLHALPPECAGDREGYLDRICDEVLPAVAEEGLAGQVDAFLEPIAFTATECARFFRAARSRGLDIRLHADQRTDGGGAELAARFGARSADHLERTSEAGVRAMAEAGTVAVLLPGAAHFLRDPTRPPVEAFRTAGVPLAVATDLNPGSSPLRSPLLALHLACTLFGLTPVEAVGGMTRVAARVLGVEEEVGTLEPGKRADLAVWDVGHPAELAYWMGDDGARSVVKGGRVVAGEGVG